MKRSHGHQIWTVRSSDCPTSNAFSFWAESNNRSLPIFDTHISNTHPNIWLLPYKHTHTHAYQTHSRTQNTLKAKPVAQNEYEIRVKRWSCRCPLNKKTKQTNKKNYIQAPRALKQRPRTHSCRIVLIPSTTAGKISDSCESHFILLFIKERLDIRPRQIGGCYLLSWVGLRFFGRCWITRRSYDFFGWLRMHII